jgi:hypothetical protein
MQNKFSKTKGVKKKILKTNYKRIKKKKQKEWHRWAKCKE